MKRRALVVGGVAAERTGDIGAGRAVVVLDERVDLVAFEVRELGASVIGHGVAVAAIGRVLVGAEQIPRRRQPEPAGGAARHDDCPGADHQEFAGARVHPDRAADAPVRRGQQPGRHVAVDHADAQAAQLAIQHLLHVMALRHRQHVGAHVVHLAHRVVAGAVLLELHVQTVEIADHVVAAVRIGHQRLLMHDPVVGDGDLFHILLGRGVAGDHRVVQPVHPHGDGAAALHVGFFQQHHTQVRIGLLGADRGHRPAGAAADHEHVGLQGLGLGRAHAAVSVASCAR